MLIEIWPPEFFPTPAVIHLNSCPSVRLCQVLVGCARAKLLIRTYSADVESATPDALERLLAWKDRRIHHEIEDESTEEYKSFKPVLVDLFDKGLGDDNGDDGDEDRNDIMII